LNQQQYNKLIAKTAEETGYSEELVDCIVDFYWKEIKLKMNTLKFLRIKIINFGVFTINHLKLEKRYEDLKSKIEQSELPLTFGRMERYNEAVEYCAKLEKLVADTKKEYELEKQHIIKKHGELYYKNLERKRQNIRRRKKLSVQDGAC